MPRHNIRPKKINIQGRSLIEHLKDFRSSMKSNSRASQHLENFIVFDEAQRAWKEQSSNHSYQTQLDQLCAWLNQKDHGVLLLLVGDGQAIYNKEMPTDQMIKALDSAVSRYRDNMSLIIPLLHQDLIKNAPYLICDHLYLKNPIRQIYTDHLADWIEAVLAADHKAAKQISLNMHGEYPLYVCRTKALADNCARRLFNQHHEDCNEIGLSKTPFRMGWFISNKGGALQDLGEVPRDNAKIMGAWYVNAPTSDQSCCELKTACNEFGCQGLELSIALVHWGKDLLFRNGSLELSSESKYRRKLEFYTWGVYRVLLSRGRNALIIMADDAETYEFLKKCGMESCN